MEFKGNGIGSKIYLIDYFEENSNVQYPFNGERGSLVFSRLGSFALLDSVRFANITMMGEDKVINDIIATDPQVIITFSNEIDKNLLYTTRQAIDIQGDVYDIKLNEKSFKLIPLVSPSFILEHQNDKNLLDRFTDGFRKAKEIINGTYVDILSQKEILYAWSYDEFIDLYESKLKGSKLIAYDIETNARPPMYKGSEIIGFSLANKHTGIYTCMSALDNEMSSEDKQKIWNYVKENIFENDEIKLIIHNTMYERPYTLYCVGYEIPFDKAEDTLVMSRLSKGPKESGGLKYQAQSNSGYPDWETDLNIYINIVTFFIERVGMGPKKYTAILDDLKKISFIQEISLSDIFKTGAFNKLHQEDRDEITGQYNRLKSLLLDNYTEEETEDLLKLIYKKVIETVKNGGIQDSIIPYNWLPIRILSKYGAVDTLATYDLYDYYMKEFDEQSTDKIDLHKGYQNWLEHIYCAYILERNGMYWDDETAQKDRDFLNEQAFRTLKEMMLSPCFEWKITEYGDKYKALILSDYLPEIAEAQGYNVQYDKILNNYTVIQNNKKVAKGKLNEIKISDYYKNDYDEIVKDLFHEEIDKAKNFEELKEIYNPSSNIETDIPRKILLDEETDRGHILLQLYELANSAEFKEKVPTLPQEEQKLLQLACYCSKTYLQDNDCIQLNDSRKQFYETFWKLFEQYYNNDYKKIKTKEIKDIFKKNSHLDVEHFDDGGIIAIYDSLCMTNGIDVDDENTWTDQFRWLIDFRLFKKSAKIMTSYIDGSIGRESVTIVDKKSLQNGDKCVERKRNYFDNVADLSVPSVIEPNEDYLLAARWSPNTAETGRWRSGFHTIPWGSQVKKYYGSRFKGGTTFHPDYSQMEVRSLSAISKDKNMLDLFASGKDFHTETAKKIYKKDEVTAAERRFSKQATFALLYGSSEQSFARSYCNGDKDYAHMIFQGFFEAYPDVEKWVNERHEEVMKDNRVSLELSNRFIKIEPENDSPQEIAAIKRKAQNYPIQGQSADLTGCVMFRVQQYLEEHNMKSMLFQYVHDSIEIDVHPDEMIQLCVELEPLLLKLPMDLFGLPSKTEMALGKSLGDELEVGDVEANDDYTECTMTLKGYKDEIYDTVDNWKSYYPLVEILEEDYEEQFVSMADLFIMKKAYTPNLGTTRYNGKCKVHVVNKK